MDPFAFAVALSPVAIYLLLLGVINLSRRPRVLTGGRETLALGLALSGFAIVGPMQLFFPFSAAASFGALTWALLLTLYALLVMLWVLITPPKLVIYNFTAEELRPILTRLAERLQAQADWAGDCVSLSQPRVTFRIEDVAALRNVSLTAVGPGQSYDAWGDLERELRAALAGARTARNPPGLTMLVSAIVILAIVLEKTVSGPQAIAQGLFDLLRL